MSEDPAHPTSPLKTWVAGALGGLATFVVSAPTELIKCRTQVYKDATSSFTVARQTWRQEGIQGLYHGGVITALRDSIGYGFYFWSYELLRQSLGKRATALGAGAANSDGLAIIEESSANQTSEALSILFCGGIAGIVTWASIFPLDVIKTRVQTQAFEPDLMPRPGEPHETERLLQARRAVLRDEARRQGPWEIAKAAYRNEGIGVFFRGLGICSARAFVVNAVQWSVYEWMMMILNEN